MSDKSVVNVKIPVECLEYLKHITNKVISVGMEPPIGLKLHNELLALAPPLCPGPRGTAPAAPPLVGPAPIPHL